MQESSNLISSAGSAGDVDLSIISLVISADLTVKIVVLILLFSSIWSWAIIISKFVSLSQIKSKMKSFESFFWSGQLFDSLYEATKRRIDNPLAAVFVSAMDEFYRKPEVRDHNKDLLLMGHKERINKSMYLVRNREIEKMESNLSFLATVSSSSVFVGLFGTVWGIIHSFQSIAASKNTSLAIVAPGIAEALVVTAIGLFVAIPAGIFYNYLISQIDSISYKIDNFSGEISRNISRNIDNTKF